MLIIVLSTGFKHGSRAADIIITAKDTDSLLEVMRLWGLGTSLETDGLRETS